MSFTFSLTLVYRQRGSYISIALDGASRATGYRLSHSSAPVFISLQPNHTSLEFIKQNKKDRHYDIDLQFIAIVYSVTYISNISSPKYDLDQNHFLHTIYDSRLSFLKNSARLNFGKCLYRWLPLWRRGD